mgnify:CR=1 FL=1
MDFVNIIFESIGIYKNPIFVNSYTGVWKGDSPFPV